MKTRLAAAVIAVTGCTHPAAVWAMPPSDGVAVAVRIEAARLADDRKSIRIEFADRRTTEVSVEDDDETFGVPRVSPERRAVGWSTLRPEGASYATPIGIVVYAGSGVRHVVCDGGMPWRWAFAGTGRIVLECANPHGAAAASRQLIDIASGKVLDRIALDADQRTPRRALAWAHVIDSR